MRRAGQADVLSLVRLAWLWQRHGVAGWSGRYHCDLEVLVDSVRAGFDVGAQRHLVVEIDRHGGLDGGDPES